MLNASRAHLAEYREGYFAHLVAALRISGTLIVAASACAVHAFLPGLFVRSASLRVERVRAGILARHMTANFPQALPFGTAAVISSMESDGGLMDPQAILLDPPVRSLPLTELEAAT